MTREDMRIFCLMLGFVATVKNGKGGADTALSLADMIEAFCLAQGAPETRVDVLIEQIKADLRDKGEADMHRERAELLELYARLAQRSGRYARDDVLADLSLALLDAEIDYENTGKGAYPMEIPF